MMKTIKKTILATAALCAVSPAYGQANQIYNPGFEMGPTRPNNNLFMPSNTSNAVGWMDGGGQPLNIVQVDGPGGWNSGNNGPESDKTGPAGTTLPRRYLDIANGTNTVFQRFTPQCNGEVRFGAWFTNRAGLAGTSRIRLLQGSATQGVQPNLPVVATTGNVNINVPNTQFAPWVEATGNANLVAGQTYTFYVDLDNNMNMDEAYVYFPNCNTRPILPDVPNPEWPRVTGVPTFTGTTFTEAVEIDGIKNLGQEIVDVPQDPQIGSSPCCAPWSELDIVPSLVPTFSNAGQPYTMQYQAQPATIAQMSAYLNYIHALDPSITTMTLTWQAIDVGTSPGMSGPAVGTPMTVTWTWTSGGVTVTPNNFQFSAPFQLSKWYRFMTTLSHNGTPNSPYFGPNCINNSKAVQWGVSAKIQNGEGDATLSTTDARGQISRANVNVIAGKPVLQGRDRRQPKM